MKLRLWKVKWHSLLTPVILLFQSIIESKDQTIKPRLTCKKRNTSSLTNQEVLFPKSKSDYIAACWKPLNGFLMPRGEKKNLNSFVWHERSFVPHEVWPLTTPPAMRLKGPLALLLLGPAKGLKFSKHSGFLCPCLGSSELLFLKGLHSKTTFSSLQPCWPTSFKDWCVPRPSETFLPPCVQSPCETDRPKGSAVC